jgi:transcriptional regulator GlxA family with amidase domain
MAGFRSVAAIVNQHVGAFSSSAWHRVLRTTARSSGCQISDLCWPAQAGPIRTPYGLTFAVEHGMDAVVNADLVLALPWDDYDMDPADEFVEPVRQAYERGAIVVGFCTGTMLLAAAGLLDGKRATTHWRSAAKLAERYPAVKLDADVLYVDEGRVLTGAGGSAGVDVCLYLMRREYGANVVAAIARDIVVPPTATGAGPVHPRPMPACESDLLQDAIGWAREHIDEPLSVDQLAALMSRAACPALKQATGPRHACCRHSACNWPRSCWRPRPAGRHGRSAGWLRHRGGPARAVRPAAWRAAVGLPPGSARDGGLAAACRTVRGQIDDRTATVGHRYPGVGVASAAGYLAPVHRGRHMATTAGLPRTATRTCSRICWKRCVRLEARRITAYRLLGTARSSSSADATGAITSISSGRSSCWQRSRRARSVRRTGETTINVSPGCLLGTRVRHHGHVIRIRLIGRAGPGETA